MFDMGCGGCSSCGSCSSCSSCNACSSCGGDSYSYKYKPMKATTRNVEDTIYCMENYDFLPMYQQQNIEFVKLDTLPDLKNWRHCCQGSGIIKLEPKQFVFEDGSTITYGTCPFCLRVHFHVEKVY